MNRRDFFKCALTVASAALLPQTARQEFPRLPAFTFDTEQMGRSLMQSYANGIYPLQGPLVMPESTGTIHISSDNGKTWELIPSADFGDIEGDTLFVWGNSDPDPGLHVG